MTPRLIIVALVVASLLLGFVTWRLQTPSPDPLYAAILFDRSESMQDPCAALAGVADHVVQLSAGRTGSTLIIFTTGDAATADEPLLLTSHLSPSRRRLLKGKHRLAQEKRAFVHALARGCSEQTPTLTSPIFLDIQHVVAHLRALENQAAERQLLVLSDLRETTEPRIRKALRQPLGTKAKLPVPIDNTGITVAICGYAQTRSQQTLQADRIIEVWRAVFTHPELVRFEPFCPKSATLEAP